METLRKLDKFSLGMVFIILIMIFAQLGERHNQHRTKTVDAYLNRHHCEYIGKSAADHKPVYRCDAGILAYSDLMGLIE